MSTSPLAALREESARGEESAGESSTPSETETVGASPDLLSIESATHSGGVSVLRPSSASGAGESRGMGAPVSAVRCEKVLLRGADGRETEEYRKICHWEA